MNYPIFYKSIKIKEGEGTEKVIDLAGSNELKLTRDAVQFISTLGKDIRPIKEYTLDFHVVGNDYTLSLDSSGLRVKKNNESPSIALAQDLSDLLGFKIDEKGWEELTLIDFGKQNFSDAKSLDNLVKQKDTSFELSSSDDTQGLKPTPLNILKKELSSSLSDDNVRLLDRYIEVSTRIKDMESEIDLVANKKKNKEELGKRQKELEAGIESTQEKLTSVESLIQMKEKNEKQLRKYGSLATDPELRAKVQTLKNRRFERIAKYLISLGSRVGNVVARKGPIYIQAREGIVGKVLLFLMAAQLVLTIVLYLVSLNEKVIYLGFVSLLVLIVLFALVNIAKNSVVTVGTVSYNQSINLSELKTDEQENQFFINSAWVGALKDEISDIEKLISVRLGNTSYKQLAQTQVEQKAELEKVLSDLGNIENKGASQEEYLKKRRNLDILKIERENMEADLPSDVTAKVKDFMSSPTIGTLQDKGGALDYRTRLPLIFLNFSKMQDSIKTEANELIRNLRGQRQILIVEVE